MFFNVWNLITFMHIIIILEAGVSEYNIEYMLRPEIFLGKENFWPISMFQVNSAVDPPGLLGRSIAFTSLVIVCGASTAWNSYPSKFEDQCSLPDLLIEYSPRWPVFLFMPSDLMYYLTWQIARWSLRYPDIGQLCLKHKAF